MNEWTDTVNHRYWCARLYFVFFFFIDVNIVRCSFQFWYWKCGFVSNFKFRSIEKCFTNINHQICRWIITSKQQHQQSATTDNSYSILVCCFSTVLFRVSVAHDSFTNWVREGKKKIIQTENDYPFNNDSFPIYEMKRNSRVLNADIHWFAYVSIFF